MGQQSAWRVVPAKGAIEIIDPTGQSHLRVRCEPRNRNAAWEPDKKGRIPRDEECVIETPWGEQVTSAPRKKDPYRRSAARREVTLGGRHFVYRHTTDRRSVVERDGQQIATLHKTWQHVWRGRRPSYQDLGFTMKAVPGLDPFDEAMIVAFGAVIGTPGHEGGFTSVCRVIPAALAELP